MKPDQGLRRLMKRMQIGGKAAEQLLAYLALLEKWNVRINLTASIAWEAVGPLFHEALWASGFCPGGSGVHLDIGSGAGFPALPLAVMHPGTDFELVESRARRAVFLEVAARELGLTRLRVVDRRLDDYLAADRSAGGWTSLSWKAVKLRRDDARELTARVPAASFWLFHGADLPLEDPVEWLEKTRLRQQAAFPGRSGWYLSMFHVKQPKSS